MTLLLMEGFDHFNVAQDEEKPNCDGAYESISSSYSRFGGQGIQLDSYNYNYSFNLGVNKSTIYFGGANKKYDAGELAYSSTYCWIRFKDEAGVTQVRLHVMPDYSIAAYKGDDTLLGASAEFAYPNLKWFYVEAKITISATVGEVTVRINGNQVLNLTSKDTKNGSDYIRNVVVGGFQPNNRGQHWDDIYVDDAQFHGDCRVKTFMPDSISGTNNSFTASAGNKDECVDEIPSNDDTDYIYSNTLNHKQGFGITTGALGTVIGIQLNNHVRIDEVGTRKITPLIRSNGTDYSGTETDVITAEYLFESEIFETDPDDSNAWTQTKLEAAEFGLEITT